MENRLRKPLIYTIIILTLTIIALICVMLQGVFFERYVPQTPAEQAYAKANALVEKDPRNADYLFERGKAYADMGRTDSAIEDLKQAIRLRPSAPMLHYTLAQIYIDLGDDGTAVSELKNELIVTKGENELAWFDLGKIYNKNKDYNQAVLCLDKALLRMKSGGDAYYEIGKAYEGLGKYNMAAKAYRSVLEFLPDDVDARSALKAIASKTVLTTKNTSPTNTNTIQDGTN